VRKLLRLSSSHGTPTASLLHHPLQQGANAAVPASDFALLHPLLYTQTKGKVMRIRGL
jgi:hypothetical protein